MTRGLKQRAPTAPQDSPEFVEAWVVQLVESPLYERLRRMAARRLPDRLQSEADWVVEQAIADLAIAARTASLPAGVDLTQERTYFLPLLNGIRKWSRIAWGHPWKFAHGSIPDDGEAASADPDASEVMEALEREKAVHEAVLRLSPEHMLVVVGYYFLGLSYAEIVVWLGLTIGTVGRLLHEARRALGRDPDLIDTLDEFPGQGGTRGGLR